MRHTLMALCDTSPKRGVMSTLSSAASLVAPLTASQIARFKRDGFLVLPGVIDPEMCRQAREEMWAVLSTKCPRMKRDDPATWLPFTTDEAAHYQNPAEDDGFPSFFAVGHRFYIRNGTDDLMLDLAPRALWGVAEQLLGKDEVVWPAGLDPSGFATGPCFMSDDLMEVLWGPETEKWPSTPLYTTEPVFRIPKSGPVWANGQGTRGLYCTLPNSPSPGPNWLGTGEPGSGAHSDGTCYGPVRLQIAAYIDDLPPASGGFTVWPGSHIRIWEEQWKAFLKTGETHAGRRERVRTAGGYEALPEPIFEQVKADTRPVDTHGPAGTIVLWHTKILHMPGQNTSQDVIRQATIYGYIKTQASLSDAMAMDNTIGDIWRDWSDEVRSVPG